MGGPPFKRRSARASNRETTSTDKKKNGGVGDRGGDQVTQTTTFLNPIRPKFSSPTLIVGRVSSNIIESMLTPALLDLAVTSAEAHAETVLVYDQRMMALSLPSLNRGGREDDNEEGAKVELGLVSEMTTSRGPSNVDECDYVADDVPPPLIRLFQTQRDVDEMSSLLFETTVHFSSPSNAWRVHANVAKFERLLDARYGRLRPFVASYPEIEAFLRNVGRKYAMGSLSPFRKGEGPVNRSTAIMALFIMHRQCVKVDAMILVATFCLVGLQPWALVTLVALGKWELERRKGRRVHGMPGRMRSCEPYYARDVSGGVVATIEESEEEERSRKYAILTRPVPGTRFNPGDLSLRDELHDVLLLGSGVEALFPAALLARAGRKVCVLSPTEDVSGCVVMDGAKDGRFSGVPFDAKGFDFAHLSHQQALLAPALCTTTDVQGGIRFARIGSDRDGYAHTVLSVPGLGNHSGVPGELVPVVINAGGPVEFADYCSMRLGDGFHSTNFKGTVDVGDSMSLGYVKACSQINAGSEDHYLSKLFGGKSDPNSYRQASVLTASEFLNQCLPFNPHVRSLMAAIGMPSENLSPENTSMAAHVTNLCSMLSEEGMAYPIGGPRALCHALASVIKQCDGRVVGGVNLQELLFDMPSKKDFGKKNDSSWENKDYGGDAASSDVVSRLKPRCRGVRLQNGGEVKVSESSGAVLSTLGFIPTFLHLLPSDVRSIYGVPPGLPAVSERRPLMKILVGLNGTKEELDLNGADWYRLPNAMLPRDEVDPLTGRVKCGRIGADEFDRTMGMVGQLERETMISTIESRSGGREMRSKDDTASSSSAPSNITQTFPLSKFTSGSSWMKVSFPSAKDPSWFYRYGSISTCVITIEADDDFAHMFDAKPRIYSILNKGSGSAGDTALSHRVMKDLCATFPQLEGKVDCIQICGPYRSGLTQNPARFSIKGNCPEMPYPGLFMGGTDLTVADSSAGAIVGGWMAANAIMGYSFTDHWYLKKNITNDLQRFLDDPIMTMEKDGVIVEDLAVPFNRIVVGKGKDPGVVTNLAGRIY